MMNKKSTLDYNQLENKIDKKHYKLADVKDKLIKVAFDIVRFKDSDKAADLWQIQAGDDGEYIVALYQKDDDTVEKTANNWSVYVNKFASSMEICYKGESLVSVASSKLGMTLEDLEKAKNYLPLKLAQNKDLVKVILNDLDKTTKNQVFNKYPELFN